MSNQPPITRMLRTWRRDRDPNAVPGFTAKYGRRRRKGLTQAEMAQLTGVTEGWYSKLERGVPENYSDDFLERVVRILDLDDDRRTHLFSTATGREPAPLPRADPNEIDPALAAIVHALPWPAYTYNPSWDVRIYNKTAARDYPWMLRGINVMTWALTYPEARLQLVNWEEAWAKPMASQLRLAGANSKDPRLAEVVADIKERDEAARRLLEEDLTTVTHPDGDRRWVYLPHHEEEVEVEFINVERRRNHTRLMIVVPAEAAQQARAAIPSAEASVLVDTPETPASA